MCTEHMVGCAQIETSPVRMSFVRAAELLQCRQANAAPTVQMLITSFARPYLHDDGAQTSLPVDNSAAAIAAATVVDGHVVAHTTRSRRGQPTR